MIENLTVENYRSFQSYSMSGLKRVNLLTGYNNSGKTSLLEAVEVLASAGEPRHLLGVSKRRNEFDFIDDSTGSLGCDPYHFFFNRDLSRTIRVRSANWNVSIGYHHETPSDEGNKLLVDRDGIEFLRPQIIIRLGDLNTFGTWKDKSSWGGHLKLYESFCLVEFAGTREITSKKLVELWDHILIAKAEMDPAESLRILDDAVESVAYISTDTQQGRMYIGKKGEKNRTPIGSHGEGMQRLLTLSIMLASVKGGILLVDEIDTGLHYSVLADMWKLVIATAIKNDIQVFATTHSLDCLRGLHEACERDPELAGEISLQTIDRSLNESIAGDADDLKSAMNLGIEVR